MGGVNKGVLDLFPFSAPNLILHAERGSAVGEALGDRGLCD